MKHTISEIIYSIFLCIIVITIVDSYLNLDKIQKYCCCNIEKSSQPFKFPSLKIVEIFLDNAFCIFEENNQKFLIFQPFVKKILNTYNNYTFPIKFMSFQNNNNYCKNIYTWNNEKSKYKEFWNNEKAVNKDFWNKCYTVIHEKI